MSGDGQATNPSKSLAVPRRPTITVAPFLALVLALASISAADASSSGSFRTSSGIKGLSSGSPTQTSTPASSGQSRLMSAKPHATPPAGVRPHTDLAAASKLIALSSAGLTKRSQLFPKQPTAPGDPRLSGPVLNKIGATEGGAGSFKAVYSIRADLGGGAIYPNHQAGATGRSAATLSGSASPHADTMQSSVAETRTPAPGKGLIYWLQALLTLVGLATIGWWMWNAQPRSAALIGSSQPA